MLRTLQRRVRAWRAEHGQEKEIFFSQAHPPARLALSDFTVCNELKVSIAGEGFEHLLYQFGSKQRDTRNKGTPTLFT